MGSGLALLMARRTESSKKELPEVFSIRTRDTRPLFSMTIRSCTMSFSFSSIPRVGTVQFDRIFSSSRRK
jgi:hypothetical protein